MRIIVVGAGGIGAETLKLLFQTDIPAEVRVIDRDFVEKDGLSRQTLYTEKDVGKLKANAVFEKLGFEAFSEHLDAENAASLLEGADAILDCTDNWATRCVLNAYGLENKVPWIFTSAIREESMCATFTPNTACFVCFNEKPAAPRSCRTEGITREATRIGARTQVDELARLLKGRPSLAGTLQYTDAKNRTCLTREIRKNPRCPACVKRTFVLPKASVATLCGDREFLFETKKIFGPKTLRSVTGEKTKDVYRIAAFSGELILFPSGRILARGLEKKEASTAVDALLQRLES